MENSPLSDLGSPIVLYIAPRRYVDLNCNEMHFHADVTY